MTTDALARLDALSLGFRSRYLRHAEVEAQLHAWAAAFPEVARLEVIGTTPEGRALTVLVLGHDPERQRPSVWVDGNMHATEVSGSSVALGIAEDVLRIHLGGDPRGLPAPAAARVREVVFHVLPRMSPDGAEHVLTTGGYVRSVNRDARTQTQHARWLAHDVDGDGVALLMRVRDPGGEFVDAHEHPGLMVPRTLSDEGPFYKLYPEGTIAHFDGAHVPDPYFLGDNEPDLNRNFPSTWMPESVQAGAGRFPLSEPESRAVVEYTVARPQLFAWLNLHTFGGCFIRPMGDAPDSKMDPSDLALYRQLGAWAEELTGYPMVSGFEEFTYEPDKPLRGDLSEWAYSQRGCVAYVVELWDLFTQIGKTKPKRFVEHYTHLTRADLVALARWDAEHNASRVIRPWKTVTHPQLGEVEVGGVDPRVGLSNPPYERLAEVCAKHSAHFLRVAALAPHLRVERRAVSALGGDVAHVEVVVRNEGYLPTQVLDSAKKLAWNEALVCEARGEGGLVVEGLTRHEVGHLDGWGRGLFDGGSALYFQRSRGTTGQRVVRFTTRGKGTLIVRAGSSRTGHVETRIEVP